MAGQEKNSENLLGCLVWVGLRDPVWCPDSSIKELHEPSSLSKYLETIQFKNNIADLRQRLSENNLRFGPILTVLEKSDIHPERIVLCSIESKYQAGLTQWVLEKVFNTKVHVLELRASSPANYFNVLSAFMDMVKRKQELFEVPYRVILGPGTPQMNVASILLHRAGWIKGRLQQVLDPQLNDVSYLETARKSPIVDVELDELFDELFAGGAQAEREPLPDVEFGPDFSLAKHIDAYEKRLLSEAVQKLKSEGKKPTKAMLHKECFGADNAETIRRKLSKVWNN